MKIVETTKLDVYKKQTQPVKKQVKAQEEKESKVQQKTIETPHDKIDISTLKDEANKVYANLRRIVEDMLRRQGIEIETLSKLEPEDIKVDQQARDEAAQMIGEGGPLSPESVSDRIVDFAKAVSNGDKSKMSLLRDAIEQGYEQAKELMGGELPEISSQTYDLIQEKLDAWENEE